MKVIVVTDEPGARPDLEMEVPELDGDQLQELQTLIEEFVEGLPW